MGKSQPGAFAPFSKDSPKVDSNQTLTTAHGAKLRSLGAHLMRGCPFSPEISAVLLFGHFSDFCPYAMYNISCYDVFHEPSQLVVRFWLCWANKGFLR